MARSLTSRTGRWLEVNPDGSITYPDGASEMPNFHLDDN